MCGIVGFFDRDAGEVAQHDILHGMTNSLVHRGPDDEGFWADPYAGIFLGQRRFAIIDLSPLGHQPMFSTNGRYGIIFNGEIYNYQDIRRELESQTTPRSEERRVG